MFALSGYLSAGITHKCDLCNIIAAICKSIESLFNTLHDIHVYIFL